MSPSGVTNQKTTILANYEWLTHELKSVRLFHKSATLNQGENLNHLPYQLLVHVRVRLLPSGEALHGLVAPHSGCFSFKQLLVFLHVETPTQLMCQLLQEPGLSCSQLSLPVQEHCPFMRSNLQGLKTVPQCSDIGPASFS